MVPCLNAASAANVSTRHQSWRCMRLHSALQKRAKWQPEQGGSPSGAAPHARHPNDTTRGWHLYSHALLMATTCKQRQAFRWLDGREWGHYAQAPTSIPM